VFSTVPSPGNFSADALASDHCHSTQWNNHRGRVGRLEPPFVANVTSYLVTFIQILQNVYFIYVI